MHRLPRRGRGKKTGVVRFGIVAAGGSTADPQIQAARAQLSEMLGGAEDDGFEAVLIKF